MNSWTLQADARSGIPGVALAPWPWYTAASASPTHVRVLAEAGASAVLEVQPSGNQTGNVLIVAPGTLGLADRKHKSVEATPLSLGEYRRYWLTATRPGKLTILGLVLAVIGQALQVSLELGAAWTVFDIGESGVVIVKVLRSGLIVGGLGLSAWQALLKA